MNFKNKKILMMGIGGIGVSALARYAVMKGAIVEGCDRSDSPMLDKLRKEGMNIIAENKIVAENYEYIIRSNAVPADHPVIRDAGKKNIPVFRRGEILSEILSQTQSVAVTGSHGKTTTTFLIGNLLSGAGLNPTIYAGGLDIGTGRNFIPGKGRWFVAEMDESDKTFLTAQPSITILTNLEMEHVDQYPQFSDLISAFESFVTSLPMNAILVVNGDNAVLADIVKRTAQKRKYILCGKNDANQYRLSEYEQTESGLCVKISAPGLELNIMSRLLGEHNAYNILFAAAAAREIGLNKQQIETGLKDFSGVGRRFEKLIDLKGGGVLITDYGHHPTEISAVLNAARKHCGDKKIVAVFEAHRCTRLITFMNEFVEALKIADKVIVTDIHTAGETGDYSGLVRNMREKLGMKRSEFVRNAEVLTHIKREYKGGETVIVFSAGQLDYIIRGQL